LSTWHIRPATRQPAPHLQRHTSAITNIMLLLLLLLFSSLTRV
jgi:hypothetical protein